MRHGYSEGCVVGSPEALRQRKRRALDREGYNEYMRRYRRERK